MKIGLISLGCPKNLVDSEVMLGLADVDLVYLRLSVLLCAADRLLPPGRRARLRRKRG